MITPQIRPTTRMPTASPNGETIFPGENGWVMNLNTSRTSSSIVRATMKRTWFIGEKDTLLSGEVFIDGFNLYLVVRYTKSERD